MRIDLPSDGYEMEVIHPRPGAGRLPKAVRVVVSEAEFNELRDQILEADPVRAELRRDLDEALRRIEQLTEERDRMTAQCDEAVRRAAVVDGLRPIRMEVPAELFTKPVDDELKAVIVSQAREIARLKGESE
ncbi:hypothetical protein [Streptomyces sp. SID5910]|uniref:hypothetical protein n=1 Tax=Streptomyces sp. SID5910 TaxID=2690312 RepID=UPI0013701901|nr:hypothetical protein [Streptomyces sp. SID5910]MYR43080.1 hypothetical protein [Streptomyces sp. SID5910]